VSHLELTEDLEKKGKGFRDKEVERDNIKVRIKKLWWKLWLPGS
jgi:hypothetical protein